MSEIAIEINIDGEFYPIDTDRMKRAVRFVLEQAGIQKGLMEIDIISDETIHQTNIEFLGHDYPTDVLAFEMDSDPEKHTLEGNILISAETAAASAPEYGWSAEEELLLYAVHGSLHLVGYDDHEGSDAQAMRDQERITLESVGIKIPS